MAILRLFNNIGDDGLTMFLARALCAFLLLPGLGICRAQQPETPATTVADADAPDAPSMFPHPDAARYLIAGQANIVFQAHAPFHSPYEGTNSFLSRGEYKTSMVGTLFLGFQFVKGPKFWLDGIFNEESAGGRGDSEALGLAGFTNLDVVRNPSLGSTPYMARYEVHGVVGLSDKLVDSDRTNFSLANKLPERRIEFWVGRLGLPDLLDLNSIGTDSHLQFLNWAIDNNGAWDYAANTRGYTDAAVFEYTDHDFTARYAAAAMPTVANGIDLEYDFTRASGQNVELELRRGVGDFLPSLRKRKGAVRILGFVNHANMGNYRAQNQAYLRGMTPTPDITAHTPGISVKYGVGWNFEQEISANGRVYAQFGWNEGQHESYAYTEIDQTMAVGGDYKMTRIGRPNDKAGITFVTNGIKADHKWYLQHGGLGFLLGDGGLKYAREDIVEAYYNLHAWKGVYYALDEQFVAHPGYNDARGPVMVESVRMHIDF